MEVLLLLIHCLLMFPLFVGFCVWAICCYSILSALSSFAIILQRKRELVVLLYLSSRYFVTVTIMCIFLMVRCVGLQCNCVFPGLAHLPIHYTVYQNTRL